MREAETSVPEHCGDTLLCRLEEARYNEGLDREVDMNLGSELGMEPEMNI